MSLCLGWNLGPGSKSIPLWLKAVLAQTSKTTLPEGSRLGSGEDVVVLLFDSGESLNSMN